MYSWVAEPKVRKGRALKSAYKHALKLEQHENRSGSWTRLWKLYDTGARVTMTLHGSVNRFIVAVRP